jgi:hypothetical protein
LLSANQKKVIFDFIDVTHLDSSGIGILMMCHAKLKKAGEALRIAEAREMVEEGNRLFRSRQRRLPVTVLGLARRLSLQHAEPGVLIRTWTILAFTRLMAGNPNSLQGIHSKQ